MVAQVATPVISPSEETFSGTVEVTMSCATSDATIHYTTDGSDPTTSNTSYSIPFAVSATTTVKAVAIKSGMNNSTTASKLYTLQPIYQVGDLGPAGGKIFYVNPNFTTDGWKYLEAAPADEDTLYVYGGTGIMTWATGLEIGTGQENTDTLVKRFGPTEPYRHLAYAAKICNDKVIAGYSDWFLPSRRELELMYENKAMIGGFSDTFYWCSSEYDSNFGYDKAWDQHFGSGLLRYTYKHNSSSVRAIRSFL